MDQEYENLKNGKTFRLKGNGTTTISKHAGHFGEKILTAMLGDATGKEFPAGIISVIADEEWGPKLQPVLVGSLHAVVIQQKPMIMKTRVGIGVAPFARKAPPFVWYIQKNKYGQTVSVVDGLGDTGKLIGLGGDLAGTTSRTGDEYLGLIIGLLTK